MRRAASLAVLGLTPISLQARQPDAATVLSDMRRALGGEEALQAIRTLSVSGSEERSFSGRSVSSGIELACILPDRCIKVRRVQGPAGLDAVETHGFNGDAQIARRASNIPYPPDPFVNESLDQRAERRRRAIASMRHDFGRLFVALIGLPPFDSAAMKYDGQRDFEGKSAHVISLQAPDYDALLFVDAATQRPVALAWMAIPPIVFSTSSVVAVGRGGTASWNPASPQFPQGDPAAGVAKVEHRLLYSDFKTQDGLTLPRRLKEVVDGRVVLDTRLGSYKINPKLDPDRFDPR
jgi:hypothetical protein